jgi:hypothetical protein
MNIKLFLWLIQGLISVSGFINNVHDQVSGHLDTSMATSDNNDITIFVGNKDIGIRFISNARNGRSLSSDNVSVHSLRNGKIANVGLVLLINGNGLSHDLENSAVTDSINLPNL